MADVTSTHEHEPFTLTLLLPNSGKVVIQPGEPAQLALQAIAQRGEDELSLALDYLTVAAVKFPLGHITLLDGVIVSLEMESREIGVSETVRLWRIVMDGLKEVRRFAEGAFGDPRIDGFDIPETTSPESLRTGPRPQTYGREIEVELPLI